MMQELLEKHKDYMRETCPAYRLVCAEHEALVEILGSWPGISEAFRSYEAYRPVAAPTWLGKSLPETRCLTYKNQDSSKSIMNRSFGVQFKRKHIASMFS